MSNKEMPGKKFAGGDFSPIEARIAARITGETSKLATFRDVYGTVAAKIHDCEADIGDKDDPRRLVVKTALLAATGDCLVERRR